MVSYRLIFENARGYTHAENIKKIRNEIRKTLGSRFKIHATRPFPKDDETNQITLNVSDEIPLLKLMKALKEKRSFKSLKKEKITPDSKPCPV